jgi:hypothetical protein
MSENLGEPTLIAFKETVAALTGVTSEKLSPIDGSIIGITYHFPSGCNGLVGVRFKINGRAKFPYDDMIYLDNATPIYDFPRGGYLPVKRNDKLQVDIDNGDSLNPHTITVILVAVGKI